MLAAALLVASMSTSPKTSAALDRLAIKHVVVARRPAEHVVSVITHGAFAVASGTTNGASVHDGLHLIRPGWTVVCSFSAAPSATQLQSACRFPQAIAVELSADLAAQMAAQSGNFGLATIAQERAFASARGPDRDSERARAQLLHQLNEQMRTGLITRQQAIQRWNEFRLSWLLP